MTVYASLIPPPPPGPTTKTLPICSAPSSREDRQAETRVQARENGVFDWFSQSNFGWKSQLSWIGIFLNPAGLQFPCLFLGTSRVRLPADPPPSTRASLGASLHLFQPTRETPLKILLKSCHFGGNFDPFLIQFSAQASFDRLGPSLLQRTRWRGVCSLAGSWGGGPLRNTPAHLS